MKIIGNKLTINIPRGMEIDVENSDLKTGVIMFKKKFINFNDVRSSIIAKADYSEVKKNQNKLDAINKLMNIASYYNGDWKPDWGNIGEAKYFIIKSDRPERLFVDSRLESNYGCVYFRREADAQAVIDVAQSFGIDARIVGRVEDAKANRLTIISEHGTFEY